MSNIEDNHADENFMAFHALDDLWTSGHPSLCFNLYEDLLTTSTGETANDGIDSMNHCQEPASETVDIASEPPCEPRNDFSNTAERLVLAMNQFTTTLNQYGALSHQLGSKVERLNNGLDHMECHLDNMEHRLDKMDERMKNLNLRFNSLDNLLLEVIRREQDAMRQFCDLSSHGKEM
ncbi:hypothetical protein N7492_009722 [Penicillium capsulatum]|uniref:Uncharacterized protein n=1 Tax=Penicillium capsulatum TaxID=69766 RepID=A0A9W9HPH2_9EURO|nr:hypothetical protein N7492_009722 [Penicillium capsulatum]